MSSEAQNRHLSDEEISQWLVEGPGTNAEMHLEACGVCQEKLAEAREPLALFRTAVIAWSENQPAAPLPDIAKRGRSWREWGLTNWMPLTSTAFATVALAVFLTHGGVFLNHAGTQQAARQVPAVSDAALMDQVDQEVSETVPDAMAPLTDLVSWESETTTTEAPVKHAAKKQALASHSAKLQVHLDKQE